MDQIDYNIEISRQKNIIGKAIASARIAKGYSIPQFRNELEKYGVLCGANAIDKWELGYSAPNSYQLFAVCYVLGIDDVLSYFCGDKQEEVRDI